MVVSPFWNFVVDIIHYFGRGIRKIGKLIRKIIKMEVRE